MGGAIERVVEAVMSTLITDKVMLELKLPLVDANRGTLLSKDSEQAE